MDRAEVRLTVPASPDYLACARVTGASLASLLEFSYDEVEDLRLAVDEVCFALIGSQPGSLTGPAKLRVVYTISDGQIEVVGSVQGVPEWGARLSGLARRILSVLVDTYELRPGTDTEPSSIWIVKAISGTCRTEAE
ncbi:MAG: hypothetical protein ACRDX8_05855 [Acidimicrobiales bacterium]